MLVICVGTDMAPAISLAYENGELDIMERMPRSAKRDHLVTAKLICFSYLQIGIIEFAAGMFTFYYCLNDFGMPFTVVNFLNTQIGYYPLESDFYNPYEPNFGNSNFGNSDMFT
jgi:sodium/potassium-transporting ATPase subunit alpha